MKLSLIVLLFSLIYSVQTLAVEESLCADAGTAICAQDKAPRPSILIAKSIRASAILAVNQYLSLHLNDAQFLQSIRNGLSISKNEKIRKRVLLYLSCADYLARARFSNVTPHACFTGSAATSANIDAAIQKLETETFPKSEQLFLHARELVERSVENAHYSSELKNDLKTKLRALANPSLSDGIASSIEQAMEDGNSSAELVGQAAEICDFNFLEVNAFRQMNNLIICPSVWTDAMETATESDEGIAYSTLTHEMGHVIGGAVAFNPTAHPHTEIGAESARDYGETLSCLGSYVDQHLLKLNLPPFDDAAERSSFVKRLGNPSSLQTAELFYQEYSADSVSAEAMALYFHDLPRSVDRNHLIRRNLRSLCGPGDSLDEAIQDPSLYRTSLHPSPRFRMREAYLGNLHLREELGCPARAQAACSILP